MAEYVKYPVWHFWELLTENKFSKSKEKIYWIRLVLPIYSNFGNGKNTKF